MQTLGRVLFKIVVSLFDVEKIIKCSITNFYNYNFYNNINYK